MTTKNALISGLAEYIERELITKIDVFEGKAIGEGKKSLAYSLVFRSPDRTLTDEEVNVAYEKIRKALADELKVELR